ncbi:MAG: TIGR02186 family protein [Alphaproteobacteria bacterium]|nr:TIGR02186 family protein [Alphaproteobacteria bacterium]
MKIKNIITFMTVLVLCGLYFGSSFAASQSGIMIDMAKENVDVTTGFSGSDIVVFGVAQDENGKSIKSPGIVVLLKGPQSNVVVRKKESVAGMWLNSDSIEFKNIPHFYDYAMSMSEKDIASAQTLIENGIGLNTLVFEPDDEDDVDDPEQFRQFQEALIRIWQRHGNFPLGGRKIKFIGDGLFRADFALPANIPTGMYQVEAFLFEGGKLVDKREKLLDVQQAGMSAFINHYAHTYSLLYAFFGIMMAVGMGIFSDSLSKKRGR